MKKKILFMAVALALVAVLAVPFSVSAASTDITGSITVTLTLTAPGNITLGELALGQNVGIAAPGSVVSNRAGWTLSVVDSKINNNGYMTVGGEDSPSAVKLAGPLAYDIMGQWAGSVITYQSSFEFLSGYGQVGTCSIPLKVEQNVVGSDAAGSYKITLTYTVTPAL